jgi:hypothetical protein
VRPRRAAARREAGYTLVELLISLLLLVLVVEIAAQLLGETQQMLVDAGREALDPAAGLVAVRLRADVLSASSAIATVKPDLSCAYLELFGNPPGPIAYQLKGGTLVRMVLDANGVPIVSSIVLRGATSFHCVTSSVGGPTVVLLAYRYNRSRTRRSPLMLMPALWAPAREEVRESLILTLRGAGLGTSW